MLAVAANVPKMPQLNGEDGDDLGASDELIAFKDEGEREEKRNVSAERDLDDVKSSLVNESETNSSSDSEVSPLGSAWNFCPPRRRRPRRASRSLPAGVCPCSLPGAGRQTPQARCRFREKGQARPAAG